MGAVKNLCKRGIVLDQGQVAFDGGVEKAVNLYLNESAKNNLADRFAGKIVPSSYIKKARFIDKNGSEVDKILSGEPLDFIIDFCCPQDVKADVNIGIYRQTGEKISRLSTEYTPIDLSTGNDHQIVFSLKKVCLNEGNYFFNITLWINKQRCDWVQDSILLNVVNGDFYNTGKFPNATDGLFLMEYSCRNK